MSEIPAYLKSLNPAQQKAAFHTDGPLLIVAGAGAGKTKTLAHRMAHLIATTTPGHCILGITFTNKAARELRERVRALLLEEGIGSPEAGDEPLITTFHGLGVHILKNESRLVGRSRWFSIFDRADSISLIKKLMKERGYDPKVVDPKKILGVISSNKSQLQDVAEYEKEAHNPFTKIVVHIWGAYDKTLKDSNAYDFDDLIRVPVILLRDHKGVREHYQKRFTHIHIDEYQDTSNAQDQFARYLVGEGDNLCVVGDSDQSIYGWRDADPSNLLYFEKTYPSATAVFLEENYRSTKPIIEAANAVISKNTARHEKTLFTQKESDTPITIYEAVNEYDEARYLAEQIAQNIQNGTKPSDIAILYRANHQSRAFEETLLRAGINYQLVGVRFYERKEVKDVLAYLRLAMNEGDVMSILRVINTPKRGLGTKAQELITAGKAGELPAKARKAFNEFSSFITTLRSQLTEIKPSEIVASIIENTGLRKELEAQNEDERLENLQELVSLAARYDALAIGEGIALMLEHASLMSDQDELGADNEGGVRLMTVHSAKGLEFETVYIAGLEQGLFPSERATKSSGDSQIQSEEERRLCYVAITRAKQKLTLSYAGMRTVFGSTEARMPSEFLADIPKHLSDFQSGTGASGFYRQNDNDLDVIQWDCLK
ncbi:MAG: 3'-5' exonuclease [bacterium]|nr:3'-5' exonuclease [bacterium]